MDQTLLPLSNGTGSIPKVGLGTWTFFGNQGNAEEVETAMCAAVDAGYRHFDCAWIYGTQDEVGRVLEKKIKEGVIERKDVFITSKLWNTHHNPKVVIEQLQESLKQLRTDYVDMFLVHWPLAFKDQDVTSNMFEPKDENGKIEFANYPLEDIWREMEKCHRAGLTRNIGVSNFNCKQMETIFKCCTVRPSNNQIEVSPYFSNERLVKFCKEKGVVVTAYAPLGAPSRPWKTSSDPDPFNEQILKEIAKRKEKTVAQVIIRFHLQNGISVVPKSITPSRIQENINVFDFELSSDEMRKIKSLNQNLRIYELSDWTEHPEFPFHEPL